MAKLSRLISNKRGTNPGGGAVRVSPGVYRQAMPQAKPAPQRPQMAPPLQYQPQQPPAQGGEMFTGGSQRFNEATGQYDQMSMPRGGFGFGDNSPFSKVAQRSGGGYGYAPQGVPMQRPTFPQGGGYAGPQQGDMQVMGQPAQEWLKFNR